MIFKRKKAQGSLEYLIIIAAVLAIAAVVVLYLSGILSGSAASFSQCRLKASECKVMQAAAAFNCHDMCEPACVDDHGNDIKTGQPAVLACTKGHDSACGRCMIGRVEGIEPTGGTDGGGSSSAFYFEDFEGANDQDLTTYDAQWTVFPTSASYTAKINTSQALTGSSSLCLNADGDSGSISAERVVGEFNTNTYTLWWRMHVTGTNPIGTIIQTYSSDDKRYAMLTFGESGSTWDIKYFNGNTWTDTGENYEKNTWYKITIQQDVSQGKWSAWIDGGKLYNINIVNGAQRREAGTASVNKIRFKVNDAGVTEKGASWFDTIEIS